MCSCQRRAARRRLRRGRTPFGVAIDRTSIRRPHNGPSARNVTLLVRAPDQVAVLLNALDVSLRLLLGDNCVCARRARARAREVLCPCRAAGAAGAARGRCTAPRERATPRRAQKPVLIMKSSIPAPSTKLPPIVIPSRRVKKADAMLCATGCQRN